MDTLLVALRVALSLAAVLGLLWALQRRLIRGSRATRSQNTVTVVGRQGLGQKASVVVVDIDGRRFVLGVTEQSVNVLHDGDSPPAPTPESVAEPQSVPAAGDTVFARSLDAATGRVAAHAATARRSRLGGSILSPATWQQTAAALRQGR
ncbi:flagellar biosynthetic protein FliO [Cryobacterium fucosi]|uniref:Flagellar protein n=1 Tax=Cryobacterium fucosi TaxID=1259157 RepID=A0A4R9BC66_9MICO|nr:flagellar biosynthetic protein FliO [Cryobacterium fucosi]TFD80768.1 flagellar biosynthetic protein FliO [Cryobacterium fucosi]